MFSGDRKDFTPWFMAFSAYVAWKLVKSATIADGTRSRPAVPERILARADPRPADIPAVQRDVDGNITNQAEIDAAGAAIAAWLALPEDTCSNQTEIDAAKSARAFLLTGVIEGEL